MGRGHESTPPTVSSLFGLPVRPPRVSAHHQGALTHQSRRLLVLPLQKQGAQGRTGPPTVSPVC